MDPRPINLDSLELRLSELSVNEANDLLDTLGHEELMIAIQQGRDELAQSMQSREAMNTHHQAQFSLLLTQAQKLKDLHKPAQAVMTLYRALSLKPDYLHTHLELGKLLLKLGRRTNAIYHLGKAKTDYSLYAEAVHYIEIAQRPICNLAAGDSANNDSY